MMRKMPESVCSENSKEGLRVRLLLKTSGISSGIGEQGGQT